MPADILENTVFRQQVVTSVSMMPKICARSFTEICISIPVSYSQNSQWCCSLSLRALVVIFTRAIILSKIQELFKKLFNYLVQVCWIFINTSNEINNLRPDIVFDHCFSIVFLLFSPTSFQSVSHAIQIN